MRPGFVAAVILSFVFAACGGGGANDDQPTTSAPQDTAGDTETTEQTDVPDTTAPEDTTSTSQPESDQGDNDGEDAGLSGRIAWSSDRDGNREIYVMDLSDSTITRLTDDPAPDYYPNVVTRRHDDCFCLGA